MEAVGTVQKIVTSTYSGDKKPEYNVGEWVRVYCGSQEGHSFCIKDVRYNHDFGGFEYLYEMYGWRAEGMIVSASSRKGWHYDSQGYCDNPGRGY